MNTVRDMQRYGDFENALKYLDVLKDKYGETPPILSLYKSIYSDAKMYPELEDLIRREMARTPDNPLLVAELGNVRFLRDDRDGADSLWSLALENAGKNQAVYVFVANYKLRYGDYEGAADTYLLGRKRFSIPNMFSSELANIYESQRDYPAAVNEYLVELLALPDRLSSVSTKILGIIDDSDDIDPIIATVKNKLEKNKDSDVLYEMLGEIYIKAGRMQLAFDTYRTLGRGNNDDGESLFRFAERCMDFKAYDTAIAAADEYISSSKGLRRKDSALLLKGNALMHKEYYPQALSLFQDLADSARDLRIKSEAGYMMGQIYVKIDRRPEAIAIWRSTLESCRDSQIRTMIIYAMAESQIKLGAYADAESLLTIIANEGRIEELKQSALFSLGDLALFKGDYMTAQNNYLDIVRHDPGSDYANDAIARISILSELGIDTSGITADNGVLELYADAVEAQTLGQFDRAASILLSDKIAGSPIAEQCLYYAGVIYSEANIVKKAISTLKTYVDKYPEGLFADRAYLALGDQYSKNPETVELGKEAYNTILEAFQDGPVTELARERLRQLESQEKIG